MIKFGKGVVKSRFVIFIAALLLLIPAALGYFHTRVNYDILTYLPDDIDTMKGQEILLDEFGTGAFSMCVVEGMDNKDVATLMRKMPRCWQSSLTLPCRQMRRWMPLRSFGA